MNQQDHDTLIALQSEMGYVHTNLGALCKQIDRYMEVNKEDHDKINNLITNQMAECPKTFLLSKTFYWVAGFLILGLLTVGAATIANQVDINTVETIISTEAHHDD